MKVVLIIIFSIFILTASKAGLPICSLQTAKQALPPRIFAEITIDGRNQPVLLTRFLHNKAGIFASEFARCYFNTLDPNFITDSVSLPGLIFWLYFIYRLLIFRKWFVLGIIVLLPILPFLNFSISINVFTYKIFAIIGLFFLISKPTSVKLKLR